MFKKRNTPRSAIESGLDVGSGDSATAVRHELGPTKWLIRPTAIATVLESRLQSPFG